MATRKLIVELIGDDDSLLRSYRRSSNGAKQLKGDLDKTVRGALAGSGAFRSLGRSLAFASTAFLGTASAVAVVRDSIGVASDLNEQINKTKVVFGESGAEVVRWSTDTATGLGIARNEALATAATFGNLLVPMGLARKEAAGFSTRLVKLAADLASFNNADPSDVLEALRSGLTGEVEPLRRFGVFLSQARIQAEALSAGLLKANVDSRKVGIAQSAVAIAQAKLLAARKKFGVGTTQTAQAESTLAAANLRLEKSLAGSVPQLTAQQKALATIRIIMRDTSDAQGDFARTSNGLANQQRILKAQITNFEASLGRLLLPTILKIVRGMNDWLSKNENQQRVLNALKSAIAAAKSAAAALLEVIRALTPVVEGIVKAFGGLKNTLLVIGGLKLASWAAGIAKSFNLIGGAAAGAAGPAGVGGLIGSLTRLSKIAAGGFAIGSAGTTSRSIGGVPFGPQDVQAGPGLLTAYFDPIDGKHRLVEVKKGESDKQAAQRDFDKRHPGARRASALGAAKASAGLKLIAETLKRADRPRAQRTTAQAEPTVTVPSPSAQVRQLAVGQAAAARRQAERDRRQAATEARRRRRLAQIRAREIRAEQRRARQFRTLGLTATGDQPVAGVRQLSRAVGTFESAFADTFLNTKKTRSVIANIKRVLSGDLGAVGRDVRRKIQEILADLNQQLRDHANKVNQLGFRQANTKALLAGLGLSPEQLKAARARLSQLGPRGTIPGSGVGAFGVAFAGANAANFATAAHERPIVIHHTTTLDGRTVEQSTTKHQQNRRRRNPPQRRGRFAGGTI